MSLEGSHTQTDMLSVYLPTEEINVTGDTKADYVYDVTNKAVPSYQEKDCSPVEKRPVDALYIYPSRQIEIKTQDVTFLNGRVIACFGVKVHRVQPLVYLFESVELGSVPMECDNIHEADALWTELLEYEKSVK